MKTQHYSSTSNIDGNKSVHYAKNVDTHYLSNSSSKSSSNTISNGNCNNKIISTPPPIDFIRNPILKVNTAHNHHHHHQHHYNQHRSPSPKQLTSSSRSRSYTYLNNHDSNRSSQTPQKTVNIVTPLVSPAPSVISTVGSTFQFKNNNPKLESALSANISFVKFSLILSLSFLLVPFIL